MSAPRQVLPGTTYFVTARCSERRFFLRPSDSTNAILEYCLAAAARRYGIQLHAVCVLSNHIHQVLTDVDGTLPAFMQHFASLSARAMNALLGRREALWSTEGYTPVRLVDAADVVEKIAYTLANPVAAGLVPHGREWPGLWSAPQDIGCGEKTVARPSSFFRQTGPAPAQVRFELTVPCVFESREEFLSSVTEALERHEAAARATLQTEGRRFLGVDHVLRQNPFEAPATTETSEGLRPLVAARNKWRRMEALLRIRAFLDAYRKALLAWTRGARDVLFPAGTYHMRVVHAVSCAPPG